MKFWEFRNAAPKVGELTLYGEISDVSWFGDEVTPKLFSDELKALGEIEELNIYLHSGGGDVFAGDAIYSIIKRCGAKITVYVDGLAASIASEIAMAGDKIIMAENAMMMIHEAWSYARGNKRELRARANVLEKIDNKLADLYAKRCGKSKDSVLQMMEAETWMTAQEAKENGFADEIEEGKKIAASIDGDFLCMGSIRIDTKRYQNMPEIEPCNGDAGQPVKDKSGANSTETALRDQRRQFAQMRRKIMNAIGGTNE